MGNISKNFNFNEFLVSDKRPDLLPKGGIITELQGISDTEALLGDTVLTPHEHALMRLGVLATSCLQPLRDYVGYSGKIVSGYRSLALNKAIGGEEDSDHTYALASDIEFPGHEEDLFKYYKWAVKNLCYRQIIYYPSDKFIHVSINWVGREYKHRARVKVGKDYVPLEEFAS